MSTLTPNRRDVLKVAVATLPAWYTAELRAADEAKPPTDREKPKIALVGCGGRGRGVAKDAERFGTVVALCDVDTRHAEQVRPMFPGATVYTDFRKMLDKEQGVSVVVNGTPDQWHTLINIAAMKAGKDVYSEKPLTRTIDEGKRVVAVAKQTGRVLQTGSQQRSDPQFRLACEIVRNGRLGKLSEVVTYLPAGPIGGPFQTAPIPMGLDWEFWQGPAATYDYVPQRCHNHFRYWLDYSGGTLTDWGAHHNDIALWALGHERSGPVTAEGRGLSQLTPGGYTAPADFEVTYTYADGVVHRCLSTRASGLGGMPIPGADPKLPPHGVRFVGSDGWLFVTRGRIESSKPDILHDNFTDREVRLAVSTDHLGNFFDCVKTRKPPICDAEIGHRSASVCHLGGIAIRLGRRLTWNPDAEEFVNDAEANRHVAPPMREPWTYDAV